MEEMELTFDWFSQGRTHTIMDLVIASCEPKPTIIVTANFYNLGLTQGNLSTHTAIALFT